MEYCPNCKEVQEKIKDTEKCPTADSLNIGEGALLFVTAKIQNKVFEALVDTGAEKSLMNKNVCIDKMEKVIPKKILTEGINKETRPAEGTI